MRRTNNPLYSKNGTETHGMFGASHNPDDGVLVGSLDDFFNSSHNKDDNGNTLYDRAFGIRTDSKTDEEIKKAASGEVNSYYSLVGASCVDVWNLAFKESGHPQWSGSLVPNVDFKLIDYFSSMNWRIHFDVKVPSIEVGEIMTGKEYDALFKNSQTE